MVRFSSSLYNIQELTLTLNLTRGLILDNTGVHFCSADNFRSTLYFAPTEFIYFLFCSRSHIYFQF